MAREGGKVRWLAVVQGVAVLVVALGVAVYLSWIRVPAEWSPWGPVELEKEPGFFARMQINGLVGEPDACFAALDRSKLEYSRIDDRPVRDGCGMPAGLVVERSNVPYSRGFAASCPLAAALYWYEREVAVLARQRLGSDLSRIEHLGTYACRNINSAAAGRRSQHATANAIDIAGFTLADGRRIEVLDDWGEDTPAGRFLAEAHQTACGLFNTVLGPEYNALHANHFHFDLGRSRVCR